MLAFLSAQSDGANRIAAIRARLDTLTLRDEAYLGEVDLSVGEAPLSELLGPFWSGVQIRFAL